MDKLFSAEHLYRLRNQIPLNSVLEQLAWPSKTRDGRYCFLCPRCSETLTAINPRTNLGRCFRSQLNFNAIDLAMRIRDCDFVTAVHFLEPYLPSSTE